ALAVAARTPELALVITCDEFGDGRRARLARHFLDLLGRPDVGVVAGRSRADSRYRCCDHLTPSHDEQLPAPQGPDAIAAAVTEATSSVSAGSRARWVALGPLTNLADLATSHPDLTHRVQVTVMGGALNYRHPDRAEHNIRLDVDAARTALDLIDQPRL